MSVKLNFGMIGIGNWGKNLIRDLSKYGYIEKCHSTGNQNNIRWVKNNYPSIKYVSDKNKIFNDDKINAVVISAPIKTHYSLVKKALLAKKHVFVEKPLCTNVSDANELIKIAKKNNLLLFVGHIFIFNEIFKKLVQISKKENIQFIYFQWTKFGTFDEDIFLNLLSHDISIILKLFGKPKKIKLISSSGFISKNDVVTLNLEFSQNKKCQIYLNRHSHHTQKTISVLTNKNIYFWNDSKLYKYNKKSGNSQLIFKSKLTPLENECKEFISELEKTQKSQEYANLAKDVIQVIRKLK
jgi:UDP-2-acetamido-3-amino-2,3-dideoxy-glucuronate N-acetyltransferase